MNKFGLALLPTLMLAAPESWANDLEDAARDIINCQNIQDPEVRLACFDAAAKPVARALRSTTGSASEDVSGRESAGAGARNEGDGADRRTPTEDAGTRQVRETARSSDPESPESAEQDVPNWASPPAKDESGSGNDPDQFEATIVRITRNNVGRHWFYTEDGAVWEQTQLVEFRAPESLPAKAEFRRRWTGNPTIQFEVSNKSYRVRRIE